MGFLKFRILSLDETVEDRERIGAKHTNIFLIWKSLLFTFLFSLQDKIKNSYYFSKIHNST